MKRYIPVLVILVMLTSLMSIIAVPASAAAPVANAGGPYTVNEGSSIVLNGIGSDPEGNPVVFAWDLDNDGQYDDATGANPTFSAAGIDGPASRNIGLEVSESASIFWDFASSPYVGASDSPTLSGTANNTTGC